MANAEVAARIKAETIPIVNGATFVCNACCEQMRLSFVDGYVIGDCPDHLQVVIHDSRVVSAMTRGVRS